jgi:signal transduction histidine kinase
MRRRLILTVAAVVSMVQLAMLVPMAVLLQDYALEDRLSRAALEVQATETVVSGGDDGDVAVYVATINEASEITTTVLYPGGKAIGPTPGEDRRVVQARLTGLARVDDTEGGAEILVPVSLGPSSGTPAQTPVIRVEVAEPSLGSGIYRVWLVLAGLGLVLLLGALVLADRLGRSFVQPIEALAGFARRLGEDQRPEPVTIVGPSEIEQLGQALNRLVGRVEGLLARERAQVADLSHRLRTPVTALQLRIDSLPPSATRDRLAADLGEIRVTTDQIVREARRSEREGLMPQAAAVDVLAERARFWEPLAEDQDRHFALVIEPGAGGRVRASEDDLAALLDVLLDNVFSHTPEGAAMQVRIAPRPGGGVVLTVDDSGPGFTVETVERGRSLAGSTGLGLSIATKTATESGGRLRVDRSEAGGGQVVVDLGPIQ